MLLRTLLAVSSIAILGNIFGINGTRQIYSLNDIYSAGNGNYEVPARCLSSNTVEATLSDQSGTIVLRSSINCYGQTGIASIAVNGRERRLYKFKEQVVVLADYPLISVHRTVGKWMATIDVDGKHVTVPLIKNGNSNKVVKTNNGFIRP